MVYVGWLAGLLAHSQCSRTLADVSFRTCAARRVGKIHHIVGVRMHTVYSEYSKASLTSLWEMRCNEREKERRRRRKPSNKKIDVARSRESHGAFEELDALFIIFMLMS